MLASKLAGIELLTIRGATTTITDGVGAVATSFTVTRGGPMVRVRRTGTSHDRSVLLVGIAAVEVVSRGVASRTDEGTRITATAGMAELSIHLQGQS